MSQATYPTTAPPASGPVRPARQILAWTAVVILAAAAVVGSNTFSIRDQLLGSALPAPVVPATSRVASDPEPGVAPEPLALRSAPWWQTVTTLDGTGGVTSVPFTIDPRSIEWRVTWTCATGRLLVRAPGEPPLVDAACPEGVGHAERTGSTTLEVSADGPWRLEVAQRIDLPLVEPPLPGMTAPGTSTLATGSFYNVDKVAAGRVTIYDQADGAYTVRLEDFWVTPNTSLQLRLSSVESPDSSAEYLSSRSQLLALLDVTAGSLNYIAPVGAEPEQFRSVVIWSPSQNTLYGAAALDPPS